MVDALTRSIALILLSAALQGATPTPSASCVDQGGARTEFAVRAHHFVDLSSEGWALSLDAKGALKVTTSEGVQRLAATSGTVAAIRDAVKAQDFWSLPSTDGTPTFFSYQRIEVCSLGRIHTVTHYFAPEGSAITEEHIRFARILLKLRRLFTSKLAADFKETEAHINRLQKVPNPGKRP